jgi:recombination protein RecA
VVKNKVAAPFREAEFDIIYGEGISREGDLLDLGVMKGLLEKSGTWISYKGERLGQGRENARLFLRENTDIRDKIENDLRKTLGLSTHSPEPAEKQAAEPEKAAAMAAAASKGRNNR